MALMSCIPVPLKLPKVSTPVKQIPSYVGSVDYTKRTDTYEAVMELDSASYDGKLEGSVVRPSNKGAKTDVTIEYTKGSTKHTARHKLEWKLTSITPKLEFELKRY